MRSCSALVLLALVTCLTSCKEAPPRTPPSQAWMLELLEENTDTFAEALAHVDLLASSPPFVWKEGYIAVNPDIAQETDPARLAAAGLTLGDPTVPAGLCSVFVVHDIYYNGTGRNGQTVHYYAFPDFVAGGAFPKVPVTDGQSLTVGPSDRPFIQALEALRIFPSKTQLDIDRGDNNNVAISWGGIERILEEGTEAVLHNASTTIAVTDGGTTGDDYIFDESFAIEEHEESTLVVDPPIDYGEITFETDLTIALLGSGPIAIEPIQLLGDLIDYDPDDDDLDPEVSQ